VQDAISQPRRVSPMSCGLASWGVVRIPWQDILRWRKDPGPAEGLTAINQLKLADEQTILAMAAVLQACQRVGWAPTGFAEWGVLAAPRYLGRARVAQIISRFKKLSVRGVSPLAIPTLSQHAVAGTICLILGCHGPNFGLGGTRSAVSEMLLNSLGVLAGHSCPGVWAIMTAWDPEPIPDGTGQLVTPATGIGIALALTAQPASGELRLVRPGLCERETSARLSVLDFADFLEQSEQRDAWRCPVLEDGYLQVSVPPLATSLPLRQTA
jgi:hypothetical protein